MKRTARLVAASAVVLISWGPARGAVLWFDETGGGGGYPAFSNLAEAYNAFVGTPGRTVNFNGLAEGTLPSDHYPGVTFSNTAGGTYSSYSGVRPDGGAIAQDVTGYDGSYMPNGDKVYVKFNNDGAGAPFTINFTSPVSVAGAFVGMGVEGGVHTLTISAFDAADQLLGTRTVNSWLWESDPSWQNYESFFALRSPEGLISRLTIHNDSTTDFANALILDNVGFTQGETSIPEPGMFMLVAAGGLAAMFARRPKGALDVSRC